MDKTEVMVDFWMTGETFNTGKITESLGVTPTKLSIKGEPNRVTHESNKLTTWLVSTGYEESKDINDQLVKIYDLFKDKLHVLNNIRREYSVDFGICIVIKIENEETPAMIINHWLIDFAHEIKAEIEFDLYIYS